MPVLILQEVTSQNINLGVSCICCKGDHSLYICRLKQTFDTFHFLVSHGVDLGTKFELTLLLHKFSQSQEDVEALFLEIWIVSSWGDEFGDLIFF